MSRGVDGRPVFHDRFDRERFTAALGRLVRTHDYMVYAWALMPNHYHLVFRPSSFSISLFMQRLGSSYARYYNLRYDRRGYLFQDRFKSLICHESDYAKELIRYVHLNPLRGGVVASFGALGNYRWSGHRTLEGSMTEDTWVSRSDALRLFGRTTRAGVDSYMAFLRAGVDIEVPPDFLRTPAGTDPYSDAPLPSVSRAARFYRSAQSARAEEVALAKRLRDHGVGIEALAEVVCTVCGIDKEELSRRGRANTRSDARAILAYSARRHLAAKVSDIAGFMGVSTAAVSQAQDRGRRLHDQHAQEILRLLP